MNRTHFFVAVEEHHQRRKAEANSRIRFLSELSVSLCDLCVLYSPFLMRFLVHRCAKNAEMTQSSQVTSLRVQRSNPGTRSQLTVE
jgi:hypothetical protein